MEPAIRWPIDPCPKCGWTSAWMVAKCVNRGGATHYPIICSCGYRSRLSVAKKTVEALNLNPSEIDPVEPRPQCAVCKADGAQEHHWAPWFLFGQEADQWPRSYLCQVCHDRWHSVVTPRRG